MCLYMKVKNAMPEKTPEFLLFAIGAVMGLIGLIVRGISSARTALTEWIISVFVAVITGWAVRDYIVSDGLYNACVATGSFFGVYIVRSIENIMKHFSVDPLETVERLRQK